VIAHWFDVNDIVLNVLDRRVSLPLTGEAHRRRPAA
jgi:hypothetical protein